MTKQNFKDLSLDSTQKGGADFFTSKDNSFVVKSMTDKEIALFLAIAESYKEKMLGKSLIIPIFGCFKLECPDVGYSQ